MPATYAVHLSESFQSSRKLAFFSAFIFKSKTRINVLVSDCYSQFSWQTVIIVMLVLSMKYLQLYDDRISPRFDYDGLYTVNK